MVLTLKRILQLENQLEAMDLELDRIIKEYYIDEDRSSLVGNIGQLIRLHAQLVDQLAEEKRKLLRPE